MKKTRAIVCVILLLILVILAFIFLNPLRRSREAINQELANVTPIGISYFEAAEKLQARFGNIKKNEKTGFFLQEIAHQEVIGTKSIQVHLGDYYHFPIGITSVEAFWGFDDAGKLIRIWVWKTTDSI